MSSAGAARRAAVTVSSARAEASRKNGAKSHGPKTAHGKARSAQNALKHGMRAEKHVVLPEEDADEFADLKGAMMEELAPVGALQTVLARRVAVAAWRLARADRIEVELFAERHIAGGGLGLALIRDGNGTRSFETLLRYRAAAMAEFWRALKTLRALQAEQGAAQTAGSAHVLESSPKRAPLPPTLVESRLGPNEPERAAGRRLEYVPSEPPAWAHPARARRAMAAERTRHPAAVLASQVDRAIGRKVNPAPALTCARPRDSLRPTRPGRHDHGQGNTRGLGRRDL